MSWRYKVNLIGTPDLIQQGSKRLIKEKLMEIPAVWHSLFLKEHFKAGAAARYQYRPRKARYLAQKRRRYGHTIPLVATGLMRRQLQRGIFTRGSASKVRGVMYGPRYAYMRTTARNNRPALGEEATATTPQERQKLGRELDERMTRALMRVRTRRTVTIA